MIHEMKLEKILEHCPKSIAENALRKNGMPTKDFFEWMVAKLYRVEKMNDIKGKIIDLIKTREQTKRRKSMKFFEHNYGD